MGNGKKREDAFEKKGRKKKKTNTVHIWGGKKLKSKF